MIVTIRVDVSPDRVASVDFQTYKYRDNPGEPWHEGELMGHYVPMNTENITADVVEEALGQLCPTRKKWRRS